MAHFAKLDENNIVIDVTVISNDDIIDGNGDEQESIGIAFCKSLFGADTNWKQTSYNKSIRKNMAGIGFTYDASRDAFIPPQPFASWSLDEGTCMWVPPIERPYAEGSYYSWDEDAYQADTNDPKTAGWVDILAAD